MHASHSENKTYIRIMSLGKIIAVIYSIGTKYICMLLSHVALEEEVEEGIVRSSPHMPAQFGYCPPLLAEQKADLAGQLYLPSCRERKKNALSILWKLVPVFFCFLLWIQVREFLWSIIPVSLVHMEG